MVVTAVVVSISIKPSMMPAWPTTQLRRRKSMTPHMFSRQRMSTPLIHPNFSMPFILPASKSWLRCRLCVFYGGERKSDWVLCSAWIFSIKLSSVDKWCRRRHKWQQRKGDMPWISFKAPLWQPATIIVRRVAIKLIIRHRSSQNRPEQGLFTYFFCQGEKVLRLLLTFDIDNPQDKPRQLYNFPAYWQAFSALFFTNFRIVCFNCQPTKYNFRKCKIN